MRKLTRHLIILFISVICTDAIYAQSVELGAIGGVQWCYLRNQDDLDEGPGMDLKNTFLWVGGLQGGYNFHRNVGVRFQLLVSQLGQNYSGDYTHINTVPSEVKSYARNIYFQGMNDGLTRYEAAIRLSFFKLPVLLKVNTNPAKKVYFLATAGPHINFRVKAKHILNGQVYDYSELFPGRNVKTEIFYRKFHIGGAVMFGAGFNLLDNLVLESGFRLEYDLGDFEDKGAKVKTVRLWEKGRAKTSSASAGILIGLMYLIPM